MTTVTANSTIGITLIAPSYTNPVAIDPGVTITSSGYGIYAATGFWTVQNAGSIAAPDSTGVDLAGGSVTNQSTGTISAASGIRIDGGLGTVSNAGAILTTGSTVAAVALTMGGYVGNTAIGLIQGSSGAGIYITGGAGSVSNSGSIASGGTYTGVVLKDGGLVSNASGGTIAPAGGAGVYATGNAGSVFNAGRIEGSGADAGVDLFDGGYVSNASSGVIVSANHSGVYGTAATVTVFNAGSILASGSAGTGGVGLKAGGYVSNATAAVISGANVPGVAVSGGAGKLINAGSILGAGGAAAVNFQLGGYVSNAATGLIRSQNHSGLYMIGAAGTVINAGSISAAGTSGTGGVALKSGGTIINASTGTISAATVDGVLVSSATGSVMNSGDIIGGAGQRGVELEDGGWVSNATAGQIDGGFDGISMVGEAGTVINSGSIDGTTGTGIFLNTGGTITNQAGAYITGGERGISFGAAYTTITNYGTISGGVGVYGQSSAGMVTNAGVISGSGTLGAVALAVGFPNELVVDPGAVFNGQASGGNTIGASVVSTLALAAGASAGTLAGLGSKYIEFGAVTFDGGASWYVTGDTAGFAGTIAGFAQGDTIEVTGITETGTSYVGGVLTLTEASGSAMLDLSGSFTPDNLIVANVNGGVQVTVACFRAGTRIRSARGEVPVEQLRVGELVEVILGGVPEPIVWIGHRTVDCRRHPRPEQVWPVRVSAGAFGPGLPDRDLFLSPDHAVYVDQVLIPIRHLINGCSIAQVPVDTVTYYHVALPQHDVVLAEGLPTESYLDTGDRSDFANGGGPIRLHPDFSSAAWLWEACGCAPLIVIGSQLDAVRGRVNGMAAMATLTAAAG